VIILGAGKNRFAGAECIVTRVKDERCLVQIKQRSRTKDGAILEFSDFHWILFKDLLNLSR
jgi:hypothetical protein